MTQAILQWLEKGSNSPAATATQQDALKALRTAAILGLSTAAVAALQAFQGLDLGPYQVIAGPLIGFALDFVRRWATDNTGK